MKIDTATLEIIMENPLKTKNKCAYNLAIPLLGVFPKEWTFYSIDTYSAMFTAVLFTITGR